MVGIYPREVVRKTRDWADSIQQLKKEVASVKAQDPKSVVMDHLHRVAFRQGLAQALYPDVSAIDIEHALKFAERCFIPADMTLLGYGVDHESLVEAAESTPLVKFAGVGKHASTNPTKYFGGEHVDTSVSPDGQVHYALAVSGSSLADDYFTALVLQQMLGSNAQTDTSVKYGNSHCLLGEISNDIDISTFNFNYTDAGLFGFYVKSESGAKVGSAVKHALQSLKSVAEGQIKDIKPAVAQAKLQLALQLESDSRSSKVQAIANQVSVSGKPLDTAYLLEKLDRVDAKTVSDFATKLIKSKKSVASIGDAYGVPSIDEL